MSSKHSSRHIFELIFWRFEEIPSFTGSGAPPQAKSTLGLDFDLQDINLIPSTLPGEELEVKKSWQVKVFRGFHFVRSLLVLPDQASSREAEAVGLIQNASPKAWDSPGFSSPGPLSLVWVWIPSMSPVTVPRLRGGGRWREEGREAAGWGGRAVREWGRWAEEQCWEVEGGGSSCSTCLRMNLSFSSCLRNRLFSPLRVFNWREKERDTEWDKCSEEEMDRQSE